MSLQATKEDKEGKEAVKVAVLQGMGRNSAVQMSGGGNSVWRAPVQGEVILDTESRSTHWGENGMLHMLMSGRSNSVRGR